MQTFLRHQPSSCGQRTCNCVEAILDNCTTSLGLGHLRSEKFSTRLFESLQELVILPLMLKIPLSDVPPTLTTLTDILRYKQMTLSRHKP